MIRVILKYVFQIYIIVNTVNKMHAWEGNCRVVGRWGERRKLALMTATNNRIFIFRLISISINFYISTISSLWCATLFVQQLNNVCEILFVLLIKHRQIAAANWYSTKHLCIQIRYSRTLVSWRNCFYFVSELKS